MSKSDGVHSCGPKCKRPLCVANRRIEELERQVRKLKAEIYECKYSEVFNGHKK